MLGNIRPDWSGQVAFIVAGGPSVKTQNLELLRGRRVIVINSSYEAVPWADILFFADPGWCKTHRVRLKGFTGRIITCSHASCFSQKVEVLHKCAPPGLAKDRNCIQMRQTSLSGAINIAVHLGVKGIVLLGADGKRGPNNETHHHSPHPKPPKEGCWGRHRQELETLVKPLNDLGIKVINASPGSAWSMWPIMSLDEALGLLIAEAA